MPGGMSEKRNPFMNGAMMAIAAWIELEATIKLIEAGTLRGVSQEELEPLRQRAHDLLDEHMDHKQGLGALSRSKS